MSGLEEIDSPWNLIDLALEDNLYSEDPYEIEQELSFLFTVGLFNNGPDIEKTKKWLNSYDYLLSETEEKIFDKFLKNLLDNGFIVNEKICVANIPPDTIDLVLMMMGARGFVSRGT